MRPASPLALGIGIVLLAAGILTLVRALKGAGSEWATYGGRIVGMMLTAGGLALCTFTLALGHWS